MRILVVEDEPDVRDFLLRVLRESSWAADGAPDARQALDACAAHEFDLAIVDVGLPDLDGFALCRELRTRGTRLPILMLTARNAVDDRVRGLDAGADDYLAKPFAVDELRARLRALSRRPTAALDPILRVADLELDSATRRVHRGGAEIALTAREYAMLEYLMRNAGRVVNRAQILAHVWDDNFDPVANAVDVLLGRVRRRVDRDGSAPLIHTMRGAGYILTDQRPPV